MSSRRELRTTLRWLIKPAVSLCAALLTLLVGEVAIRFLGLAPQIKSLQLDSYDCFYQRSTNRILGFELKPNCHSETPDFIQTYERTNAHGQRDKERTIAKPPGIKRILLLGDSVVEGYGLREVETISRRLEGLYDDGSTEVLNFGVSAYCTRAEIELLETKGLRFDPDVVVLVFVENDFDNFNREAFPLASVVDRPTVVKALFRKSHLFRLASIELNLFHFGVDADPARWNKEAIGDNNVAEGLRRFRELADRHGFTPVVAIWPRFLDGRIADTGFMPQNSDQLVVEHLAAMNGIPSARLSEFFRQNRAKSAATTNPRLRYSQGDELHPCPEGARVAATALKQLLDDLDTGRIPAPRVLEHPQSDAEALAAARALGQAEPDYARVHNRMGTEFLKAAQLLEAVDQFQQAIATDPTYAGAYNNLGIAYERMGNQEAQAQFEKAIELRPDFSYAHFNLARLLLKNGNNDAAAAQLKRTIKIDPNHFGALNMLGTVLGQQRKFAEAASYLERAVRLDPNHAEARSNLGAAYAGQGRLQDAVTQFEAALRIDPEDPEARENLRRVRAALQE